jgi:glycosyltransferase involved in cell wall biosynthesis
MSIPPVSVSVVMSVYNGEKYLAEAIDSILAQTFGDFEFIIVDDGSMDGSAQILAEHSARDGRIRVLSQENRGLTKSLNTAISHARAPLIARMDADDIALPCRFERQVAAFDTNPRLVGLGTAVATFTDGRANRRTRSVTCGGEAIRSALETRNVMNHPSAMIRAEALRDIGGYREKFITSQDYDLWLRLAETGDLDNLPETLLRYRVHGGRTSDTKNAHRQTIYSVAAAADHFLRKLGRTPSDAPIDTGNPEGVANDLLALLASNLPRADKKKLMRHVLRFARRVPVISAETRRELLGAARPHMGLKDRLKLKLYRI